LKLDHYTDKKLTDTYSVRIYKWALQDSADRVTQPKTTRSIDPSNLETAATVATISSATIAAVPSDLATVETDSVQLGDGKLLTVVKKGLRTREQMMEFDGSEVGLGVNAGDCTERIVEIEDCLSGDTLEDLAQSKWAAVEGGTSPTQGYPFISVRARRYHATKVIFVTTYGLRGFAIQPPTEKIRISGNIGAVRGWSWVAFDSGTPKLHVASAITRGSGKYLIQLAKQETMGIGGPLYIRQRITSGTPTLGTSSILKTNSSAFLGYPAGSVLYLGASYDVVIDNASGNSTYDMIYNFQVFIATNWVGFPTVQGIPPGGLIHATATETPGLVAGTGGPPTYTWANLGVKVIVPSTDGFSFTTWTQ
jgi:hypothetical protein